MFFVLLHIILKGGVVMDTKSKLALLINTVYYGFWALIIFVTVKYFAVYILPFIISFSIVYILQKPMIVLSGKTKINKNTLTLISLIVILGLISMAIWFVVFKIYRFFIDINSSGTLELATNYINRYVYIVEHNLPAKFLSSGENVFNKALLSLTEYAMGIATACVKHLPGLVFSTFTSIVSACFLAFEYDNFIRFIKRQISKATTERIARIKRIVNESLLGFTKGYLIIMLFTFTVIAIGLSILKVNNSIAIAIIISIIDILPIFGTGIVVLPWSIIAFITGNTILGVGLIILYVVYSIVRYFLEPKIIGKKVGVNPLISLIAMFVGLKLFGLIGLVLAPITISVLIVLQKKFNNSPLEIINVAVKLKAS